MSGQHRKCHWWQHRWSEDEWLGGLAFPAFRKTCLKCGAERIWEAGP